MLPYVIYPQSATKYGMSFDITVFIMNFISQTKQPNNMFQSGILATNNYVVLVVVAAAMVHLINLQCKQTEELMNGKNARSAAYDV